MYNNDIPVGDFTIYGKLPAFGIKGFLYNLVLKLVFILSQSDKFFFLTFIGDYAPPVISFCVYCFNGNINVL